MNKKITKIAVVAISFAVIALFVATPSFAAGGTAYGPYGPYGPHIPEDTGFGSMELFPIIGGILYVAGLSLIGYSKFIKGKIQGL